MRRWKKFCRFFLQNNLGVPLRVGLYTTTPRKASFHFAFLRGFRCNPSRSSAHRGFWYLWKFL